MSEGGKPGITAKVEVTIASAGMVTFKFENTEEAEYFRGKEGKRFVANFVPIEEKSE